MVATHWPKPEVEQCRPSRGAPFKFIASYRGEHDFEHRASGRRLVWERDRPLRWSSFDPVEAGILAEWDAWQLDEEAKFRAWCAKRDLPMPADLGVIY